VGTRHKSRGAGSKPKGAWRKAQRTAADHAETDAADRASMGLAPRTATQAKEAALASKEAFKARMQTQREAKAAVTKKSYN